MNDKPDMESPESAGQKTGAPETPPQKPEEGESWLEIAKTLVYALLIAFVIRTFLFQPFNIPSGSMEATLLVGDYVFVEKYAYGFSRYSFPFGLGPFPGRIFFSSPHRGDVVVFKFPGDNSTDYIKRLVGLPGDRVQMINGVFWLNNKPIPKVRVQDYIEYDDAGVARHVPQYRETLPGGKSYLVLDRIQGSDEDNTEQFLVPPGHYFMMGDNRDNSDDSRMSVGYVPAQNLEGKALFRFFSFDGPWFEIWEVWKWRFDRMFTGID